MADRGLSHAGRLAAAAILALAVVFSPAVVSSAVAASSAKLPGTDCQVFPADSWWHADVSKLPVHKRSADWLSNMQPSRKLHPDFGPSYGDIPGPYGMPINIVDGSAPRAKVKFLYDDESDDVRYPLGPKTKVEGFDFEADGDRHVIVVDTSTCRLFELFHVSKTGKGWSADSGATWNLASNRLRPLGFTSADAAGLPILPGLLRFDEVKRGRIDHAIRFTTDISSRHYLWPARHQAGSKDSLAFPPMGARFRLKASYRIAKSLRGDTKVVLRAMKRFGLVLADNGSPWYFQGTADKRWPEGLLDELKRVPASAFEAVDTSSLLIRRNSMAVRQ